MFAVIVEFVIKDGMMDAFLPLMKTNAAVSLRDEDGCVRFDVVTFETEPHLVFLYEAYDSKAAFDVHLKTDHFQEFDAAAADMIETKSVRTGAIL